MARHTERIRELNDQFRSTFQGGPVVVTHGVDDLDDVTKATVLRKVQDFDDFTPDNDPHGEHDFGSFKVDEQGFFWKIDLYEEEPVKPRIAAEGHPACMRRSLSSPVLRQKDIQLRTRYAQCELFRVGPIPDY